MRHLPERDRPPIKAKMRRAWRETDYHRALEQFLGLSPPPGSVARRSVPGYGDGGPPVWSPRIGFRDVELNAASGSWSVLLRIPSPFGAGMAPAVAKTIGRAFVIAFVESADAAGAAARVMSNVTAAARARVACLTLLLLCPRPATELVLAGQAM